MGIYNPFTKTKNSKSYHNIFLGIFYEAREVNDDYEVYVNNSTSIEEIIYVIKNEELGRKNYETILLLKEMEQFIFADCGFEVKKVVLNKKEKRILSFSIKVAQFGSYCYRLSRRIIGKLTLFSELVTVMAKKGFILREDLKLYADLGVLLYFRIREGSKPLTSSDCFDIGFGTLLNYIHYKMQGQEIEEFFSKYYGILEMDTLKYPLEMLEVFVNYYENHEVNYNLVDMLKNEYDSPSNYNHNDNGYKKILYSTKKFDDNYHLAGIANYKSSIYREYLIDNEIFRIYNSNYPNLEKLSEKINILGRNRNLIFNTNYIILDIHGKICGYEYNDDFSHAISLKDIFNSCDCQLKLVNLMWKLDDFFKSLLNNIHRCFNLAGESSEHGDFNIVYDDIKEEFVFSELEGLISFLCEKVDDAKSKLIKFVFCILKKYVVAYRISEGALKNNFENIHRTPEIRYLPPCFTNELSNYILGKEVDYALAYTSFFEDFRNNFIKRYDGTILYGKFCEYSTNGNYLFFNEFQQEYGLRVKDGSIQVLDDGRIVYLFDKAKKRDHIITNIAKNSKKIENSGILKLLRNDTVEMTCIEQIIYSDKIYDCQMYYIRGFIISPVKGVPINSLSISNKDFVLIAKELFICFKNKYIDLSHIRMTDNCTFYLDLREKIVLKDTPKGGFVKLILKSLNVYGLDYETINEVDFNNYEELDELYNSYDSFCNVHKSYYSSKNNMCPICSKTLYRIDKLGKKLFEDEYSTHYELTSYLNAKIYKKDLIDIKVQEAIIDKIMSGDFNLNQDMFLPLKKAMDHDNNFLGYVYYNVDFNKLIDIGSFKNNKTKLKSMITLCKQVYELERQGIYFYKYPYDKLFFSPLFKNRVQILNIDFISWDSGKLSGELNSNVDITLSNEYITSYLKSNITPEMYDGNLKSKSISGIINELKAILDDMTKYCETHMIFYNKKYYGCPICFQNFEISSMLDDVISLDVEKLQKKYKNPEHTGGESWIYKYDKDYVLKIFNDKVNLGAKFAILIKLLEKTKILERANESNSKFYYVIPKKICIDEKIHSVTGYIMKKVTGKPIYILRDKEEVKKNHLSIVDVLEILITLGEGIEYLHKEANIYIGDLNGVNILFDENKNVYFLDFDGMGVDDIAPKFFTEKYVDPLSSKNNTISMEDDWYSFAVQAFYYLTYTHPFDGLYFDKNGENLRIEERMEKRISVLGNHGVEIPTIAESWEWMNGDLLRVFRSIFEEGSRENITPYLKEYYKKMIPGLKFNKKDISFKNCSRIINEISYISCDGDLIVLFKENIEIKLPIVKRIMDVRISDDENYIFIMSKVLIRVFHDKNVILDLNIKESTRWCVNDNTLYYTDVIENENVIVKLEFEACSFKKTTIKFHTDLYIKDFFVLNNKKFLVIKQGNNEDYIFCNDMMYLTLSNTSHLTRYKIMYDRNEWLIVNTDGVYVLIRADGTNVISKDAELGRCVIDKVTFVKGNMYIPKDGGIHIVNISNSKNKYVLCDMCKRDSRIQIIEKGFRIFNGSDTFEYKKVE